MTSNLVLKLAVGAAVLGAAAYAGRYGVILGVAVATAGLAASRWRIVLGIPVAIALTVAAAVAPGVTLLAAVLAVFLVLLSIFVNVVYGWGGVPESDGVTPCDAMLNDPI